MGANSSLRPEEPRQSKRNYSFAFRLFWVLGNRTRGEVVEPVAILSQLDSIF